MTREDTTLSRILDVRRLGRTKYEDAYKLQQELVAQRVENAIPDTLVLTEHEPVITLGRGSKRSDVEGVQVPIFASRDTCWNTLSLRASFWLCSTSVRFFSRRRSTSSSS